MAVGTLPAKIAAIELRSRPFRAGCSTSRLTARAASSSTSRRRQHDAVRGQRGSLHHPQDGHPDVNLIFGAVIDEQMNDEVRITVIATGFDSDDMHVQPAQETTPARSSAAPPEHQDIFTTGMVDRDNIEIPAFLRRRDSR
jgi:hypothetical protein